MSPPLKTLRETADLRHLRQIVAGLTAGASASGTCPASSSAPPVERIPPTASASFTVIGSPCSGPIGS